MQLHPLARLSLLGSIFPVKLGVHRKLSRLFPMITSRNPGHLSVFRSYDVDLPQRLDHCLGAHHLPDNTGQMPYLDHS